MKKDLPKNRKIIADAMAKNKSKKDLLILVGETYNVDDTETKENILNHLQDDKEIKEYSWDKKKIIEIENNLYNLSLNAKKEADQIKAGFGIHDKIYGKAQTKVDVTSKGNELNTLADLTDKELYEITQQQENDS